MKKKSIKKLEEMKANIGCLKDMRFLLKGMNIDTKHVKLGKDYTEWPIMAPVKDGGVIEIAYDRMGYLDNRGYYFCEFQDDVKEKDSRIYMNFYDHLRVKELIMTDQEAEIAQHSFYQMGIRPSFEMFTTKDKLQDKKDNFINIMNKEMKKSFKKANKLVKKLKN